MTSLAAGVKRISAREFMKMQESGASGRDTEAVKGEGSVPG